MIPPCLLDSVISPDGQRWLRVGDGNRSIWLSLDELHDQAKAFKRLSTVGVNALTAASKNSIRQTIEKLDDYRPGVVATHPGWCGSAYVFGDGEVFAAPDTPEVIVAFDGRPKFKPRGTLEDAQALIDEYVLGKPIPSAVVSCAILGPLLRFFPQGNLNPFNEIVGLRETGKSTLLMLGASIYAGDPNSNIGGAEQWDHSPAEIDVLKLEHADGLLTLDEAELAGSSAGEQKSTIKRAIWKLATTDGRRRFGDAAPSPTYLVTISTSNTPLAELAGTGKVADALRSRAITLTVDAEADATGLSREDVEAIAQLASEHYGVLGRAFIKRLVAEVAKDEAGFRASLQFLFAKALGQMTPSGSVRVDKTFALIAVAGFIAQKWGIVGRRHPIEGTVLALHRQRFAKPDPLKRVLAYGRRHREDLVAVKDLTMPLDDDQCRATPGFRLPQGENYWFLVPTERFQQEFPDHCHLMQDLRRLNRARTEGGNTPKLSIKSPNSICRGNIRMYCIDVSRVRMNN